MTLTKSLINATHKYIRSIDDPMMVTLSYIIGQKLENMHKAYPNRDVEVVIALSIADSKFGEADVTTIKIPINAKESK